MGLLDYQYNNNEEDERYYIQNRTTGKFLKKFSYLKPADAIWVENKLEASALTEIKALRAIRLLEKCFTEINLQLVQK